MALSLLSIACDTSSYASVATVTSLVADKKAFCVPTSATVPINSFCGRILVIKSAQDPQHQDAGLCKKSRPHIHPGNIRKSPAIKMKPL